MSKMHPRNLHLKGYDLDSLCDHHPSLVQFVVRGPKQKTIDFADPAAVKALNTALLKKHYEIQHWDLPEGYLCPAIPGRADYIHHLADLLSEGLEDKIPRGAEIRILDIGTGANCIYPILGHQLYGWSFVGTETDPKAAQIAASIVQFNPPLSYHVEIRQQQQKQKILEGIVKPGERFTACICNPPFHASQSVAKKETRRKIKGLQGKDRPDPKLNFGGRSSELIYPGGEVAFIQQLIRESSRYPQLCTWFTTLVSREKNLKILQKGLQKASAKTVKILEMAQGQKRSRILAWHF